MSYWLDNKNKKLTDISKKLVHTIWTYEKIFISKREPFSDAPVV
jgi:hypothetical protein